MIDDTVAYCGLFCGSCGVYVATMKDDVEDLERIASMMKVRPEEIPCRGCRSGTLSPHCRNCEFKECARGKKLDACEECVDFPCDSLREFQRQLPHRAELFESAEYRKAHGIDAWLRKMAEDYACEKCGTVNSPYYPSCKACGNEPANPFAGRNHALFGK